MRLILKSIDGLTSHLLGIKNDDEGTSFVMPRYADIIRVKSSDRKESIIIEYKVKEIIHDYIDDCIILYGEHI